MTHLIKIISLLFCIMLSAAGTQAVCQVKANAEEQKDKADDLRRNDKDYAGALKIYRQLLQDDPKNTNILESAGICYYEMGNYNKAKEMFSMAALYTSPDDKCVIANYYSNLAAVYANLKDYDKEMNYALKAINLCDSKLVVWNAVSSLHDADRNEDALKILLQSKYASDADVSYLKGRIYYMLRQNEKSVTELKKFLDYYQDETPEYGFIDDAQQYLLYASFEGYKKAKDTTSKNWYRNEFIKVAKKLMNANNETVILSYLENKNDPADFADDTQLAESLINNTTSYKVPMLITFKRYDEALQAANELLKDKDLSADDRDNVKVLIFFAKYRKFLTGWVKSNAAPDEQQLQEVAKAFGDALANKKHIPLEGLDNDAVINKSIMGISNSMVQFGKKDKAAVKHIVTTIFNAYPNAEIRKKLLETINE